MRPPVWVVTASLLALLGVAQAGPETPSETGAPARGGELTRLTGRAVCLEPLAAAAPDLVPCDEPGARYAFETESGETVTFLEEDPRTGVFRDPRVRSQRLEVEGWLREQGRFELLSVLSIKHGERFHVHYRCDVCDITATAPGPCWCCGKDFELRETRDAPQ